MATLTLSTKGEDMSGPLRPQIFVENLNLVASLCFPHLVEGWGGRLGQNRVP